MRRVPYSRYRAVFVRAPSTVVWVVLAFVTVAAAAVYFGSPQVLGGFMLTPSAAIGEGSRLPPNAGAVGDRVVAVDGQPTSTLADVRATLSGRRAGESVEVVIERATAPESRTVTPSSFVAETLVDWRDGSTILRVEGHDPPADGWTIATLRALADALAPVPLAVEVQPPPTLTRGPVPVHRRGPEPLAVAWLAVTFLLLVGTAVFRYERLDRSSGAPTASLASLACGGIALMGLSEWAVLQSPSPLLVGLALTALVFAGAWVAASELGSGWRRPSIVLWLVGLALIVPATWIALPQVNPRSLLGLSLVLGTGTSAVRGYYAWRRSSGHWAVALGAAAASVALAGVVALFTQPEQALGLWMGLTHAAVVWASALPAALLWADEGQTVWTRQSGATGARALIEALREQAGAGEPTLFVGFGPSWVSLRRPIHASVGAEGLRASLSAPELASGLGLLAEEGISIPRPALDDDDPLGDWPDRLGLAFAVALTPPGANPPVLVGIVHPTEPANGAGEHGPLDAERCAELVAYADRDRVSTEAVAAAVGLALSQSTRRPGGPGARPGESEVADETPAPRPAARTDAPTPHPAAANVSTAPTEWAWVRHLGDQLRRRYPVDEPSLVDARESGVLRTLGARREPVLFIGEAGIGKEFMARAMVHLVDDSERRFAVLDAEAMPPSVVELALFGADDELGLCELVGNGTIVLKNLSLLDDSELRGVVARLVEHPARLVFTERYRGDETGVPSTVPTTIVELAGRRAVHLSPLRDRPEDVRRYAQWMLHRASLRHGGEVVDFTTAALDLLANEDWAMNFPELQLVVERAVLHCDADVVDVQHVRAALRSASGRGEVPLATLTPPARLEVRARGGEPAPAAPLPTGETAALSPVGYTASEREERDRILRALDANEGNRTQAARALGFTRGKLLRRLKKFGIE